MFSDQSKIQKVSLKKNEILFLAEEQENNIYMINAGQVMVFVQKGSQIIPVAYLEKGEYIGELSFFDNGARSASIICTEDSEFTRIPYEELNNKCPEWIKIIGQQLTKKLREGDELIRLKGLRKKNVDSIKPLSIEEQGAIFKLVEKLKQERSL